MNFSPSSITRPSVINGDQSRVYMSRLQKLNSRDKNNEPDDLIDDRLLAGDAAILLNMVLSFDLHVVSREATRGKNFFVWLSHFASHLPLSLNHCTAMVIAWGAALVVGNIITQRSWISGMDEPESELGVVAQVFKTWVLFLPLGATVYLAGHSGGLGGMHGMESSTRFTTGHFLAEVYFEGIFLALWRVTYYKWKRGFF